MIDSTVDYGYGEVCVKGVVDAVRSEGRFVRLAV